MNVGQQRSFNMHGIKGDAGNVTFDKDQQTVQVPTCVASVFAAGGVIDTQLRGNNQLTCTSDRKIVDGKLTFKRHGSYFGDEAVMSFWILGW